MITPETSTNSAKAPPSRENLDEVIRKSQQLRPEIVELELELCAARSGVTLGQIAVATEPGGPQPDNRTDAKCICSRTLRLCDAGDQAAVTR